MKKIISESDKNGIHEILVDDEDYERLNKRKWAVGKFKYKYYAIANFWNGKNHNVLMHRHIMRAPYKKMIDHIDGNGLNNQKSNLRFCTNAQNMMNSGKRSNGKTAKFKGVSRRPGLNVFRAVIGLNKTQIHLGYFKTEEEAAKAYNEAALEYHGQFAFLNKIDGWAETEIAIRDFL